MDARATVTRCIAFSPDRRVAVGSVLEVALALRDHFEADPEAKILVFDAETSRPVELDVHGTHDQVASRYAIAEKRAQAALAKAQEEARGGASPKKAKPGRGRPKLGVVGREVTLLPRHWEWLGKQPGGASVTLRKLVEQARRENAGADRRREAQESVYRFMLAIAGDRPGYEEALRALYADRADDFASLIAEWPADIRAHIEELSGEAFVGEVAA